MIAMEDGSNARTQTKEFKALMRAKIQDEKFAQTGFEEDEIDEALEYYEQESIVQDAIQNYIGEVY